MTLNEAISEIQSYASFDLFLREGETPTNASMTNLINRARDIVNRRRRLFNPIVKMTLVADQINYSFNSTVAFQKRILRVHRGWLNDVPTRSDDGNIGLMSRTYFESRHSRWPSQASGTPRRMVVMGSELYVYPKPDSAFITASQTGTMSESKNYVSATILENHLVSGSDDNNPLPEPDYLHDVICELAAIVSGKWRSNEDEAWRRISAVNSGAIESIDMEARENQSIMMPIDDIPAARRIHR